MLRAFTKTCLSRCFPLALMLSIGCPASDKGGVSTGDTGSTDTGSIDSAAEDTGTGDTGAGDTASPDTLQSLSCVKISRENSIWIENSKFFKVPFTQN